MRGLTVRELIYHLLDFPLDSQVGVEVAEAEETYPIRNIFHDSEYGDFGECYYDYVGIVVAPEGRKEDFKGDFKSNWVDSNWVNDKDFFEIFDEDQEEFIKLRYDKETDKFKKCDRYGVFI